MKKLYYLFLILAFTACDLQRSPLEAFGEDDFWQSETDAQLVLISLYRGNILYNKCEWQPSDWWGPTATVFLDNVSDLGYDRRDFANDLPRITSGGLQNTNQAIRALWQQPYIRIAACNAFLENAERIPSSALMERMKAEARFIRATQYFYLASYYGDTPLVTHSVTQDEANNQKKTSKAEILEYVIKEFGEAAQNLPRTKDIQATEIGRASAQAALAFQAKSYLVAKQYDKVATPLKQIIDWGDNELAADYATLFTSNENSSENIFSIQYEDNIAGHGMSQHILPRKDDGWCLVAPAANLFESYNFDNGDLFSYDDPRFDPADPAKNRDPRLAATLLYNGATFKGGVYNCHPEDGKLDKIGSALATKTGFLLRKYFDDGKILALQSYGANLPIIRYSDVLLMYLEGELESGKPVTQELLDMTINRVRARVNMPGITTTNPDEVRARLRNERKVELAYEGWRLWDLFRWGIAEQELNKDIYGAVFQVKDSNIIRKKKGQADVYGRWYVNTRSFKKGQEVWPIPQAEIDINPDLGD